jgi:hypothetical protein
MRGIVLALAASCASAPLIAQVAAPAKTAAVAAEVNAPIGAAEARATAADFARLLEENYLFPDVGRKYAETLRTRAGRGEYDRVGTRGALAAALTKDVQAVFADGHLKIIPQSAGSGPQPQMMMMMPQKGPVEPATPGEGKPIEEARWLAPGVAYIRFTIFPQDPRVTAAVAKFMSDHADAKTMIFDLRTHKGGGMSQAAAMLPYLYDKETVFLGQDARASIPEPPNMPPYMRRASSSQEGVRTTEVMARPHPSERRLVDAKVYVLTSNYTASAAEAFAFGLKASGRATLIGEPTVGAGHFAPRDNGERQVRRLHPHRQRLRPAHRQGLGRKRRRAGHQGSCPAGARRGAGSQRRRAWRGGAAFRLGPSEGANEMAAPGQLTRLDANAAN